MYYSADLYYHAYTSYFLVVQIKIYAMQAEALLKLGRHQEAYTSIENGPNFDTELCTRFFGSAGSAYLLTIQAQVYMSAGRLIECLH